MWRVEKWLQVGGGCQRLIPAFGINSFWNWNKLHLHVKARRIYLLQDLFVSIYHPWCRSLWLSDCTKRIYRPNGCRSYVPNRHFVVQLAIECHFTPQLVWLPAHSAGCSAQQWTCNSCSHYGWQHRSHFRFVRGATQRANENFRFQQLASYRMFQAVQPARRVSGNILSLQLGSPLACKVN